MDRLPGKSPEEQNRYLQQCFHEVFSTDKGKIVFNVLLNDLRFFSTCYTEQDNALRNYATVLIQERLGIKNTLVMSNYLTTCKITGEEEIDDDREHDDD